LIVVRGGDPTVGDNGGATIFLSNGDGTFRKEQTLIPGNNRLPVSALQEERARMRLDTNYQLLRKHEQPVYNSQFCSFDAFCARFNRIWLRQRKHPRNLELGRKVKVSGHRGVSRRKAFR